MTETFFKLGTNPTANFLNYLILAFIGAAIFIAILKAKEKKRTFALIFMAAIFVVLAWQLVIGPMQMGVTVSTGELEIRNSLFTGAFVVSKSEIEEIFILDWNEDEEFYPRKVVGASIGNYKTGKFKLKNGWDAKVMTIDSRVLAIKLIDHYVLLSPKDFDEFVSKVNKEFLPISNIQ